MNKRPKLNDDAVIALVAEELAIKVAGWIGSTDDIDQIENDLRQVLKFNSDGYELARELDDYNPDTELVNILDNASCIRYSAYKQICRKWVLDNNFIGPVIGSIVNFIYKGKQIEGEGISNYDYGQSMVYCESLGHVREGGGTHGAGVNWEDLTEIPK